MSQGGSRNLFLGTKAGYSETGSGKLYISSIGTSGSSINLITGDFDSGALNLGRTIGTVTALNDFVVNGAAYLYSSVAVILIGR